MMDVRLKQFSKDVDESLVVFWHVEEGDTVKAGDTLVEVQTEKAVTEIEAEEAGIVSDILVRRGDSAKVGDVLLRLAPLNASQEDQQAAQPEVEEKKTAEHEHKPFVRISPRLRKMASQLKVDLHEIRGTGRGERVTEEDIQQAARKRKQSHSTSVPFSGTRRRIAKKMTDSLQTSAQVTITSWADVTELAAEREKRNNNLSWTALTAKAALVAINNHPYVNVHVHDGEVILQDEVHLGIAVDTEAGVHVPVVRDANTLAIDKLENKINLLAEKAKARQMTAEEGSGSTFTITNLGAHSVQFFTPILNPPEAAILGIGKVESHLVLNAGVVEERKRLPLSLTFDHRAFDGVPAAKFLENVADLLHESEDVIPKPFQV